MERPSIRSRSPDSSSDGGAPVNVAEVVRANLTRSGIFRLIDAQATLSETATPDFLGLRVRGADAVLTGSVAKLADGRYDVRFRLNDVVRQASLGGESMLAAPADLRYAAHRVSDWVFEKLTGEKGIFSTRIAFVTKQGTRHRLNVADWDGENVLTPLDSAEPIISPSWSPDGTRLAYVSFESRKPVVYVHVARDRTTHRGGQLSRQQQRAGLVARREHARRGAHPRRPLADLPDHVRRQPARRAGSPLRPDIDTEPVFSPDGAQPVLHLRSWRLAADLPHGGHRRRPGADHLRLVLQRQPAREPGRASALAFVTRRDGRFLVATKNLANGTEQLISDGGREESPSFSPNGRWIMYATQFDGRDSLMAVSIDGRVKQRLTSSLGDIREPTWGPFPK